MVLPKWLTAPAPRHRGWVEKGALIDAAFDQRDVEVFLNSVSRRGLRIRDFEAILAKGLLGKDASALDQALPVSDQGLTRERYLSLVELVAADLRQRYLKLYAYY